MQLNSLRRQTKVKVLKSRRCTAHALLVLLVYYIVVLSQRVRLKNAGRSAVFKGYQNIKGSAIFHHAESAVTTVWMPFMRNMACNYTRISIMTVSPSNSCEEKHWRQRPEPDSNPRAVFLVFQVVHKILPDAIRKVLEHTLLDYILYHGKIMFSRHL